MIAIMSITAMTFATGLGWWTMMILQGVRVVDEMLNEENRDA